MYIFSVFISGSKFYKEQVWYKIHSPKFFDFGSRGINMDLTLEDKSNVNPGLNFSLPRRIQLMKKMQIRIRTTAMPTWSTRSWRRRGGWTGSPRGSTPGTRNSPGIKRLWQINIKKKTYFICCISLSEQTNPHFWILFFFFFLSLDPFY